MAKKKQNKAQPLPSPDAATAAKYSFLTDFHQVNWKTVSHREGYGIYALCLYGNYPDYFDIATESLTEGEDDKDIDFCLIDREAGAIYIGQSYLSEQWGKTTAPTNKADDLLTALSWLLTPDLKRVPQRIRRKAEEIQDSIRQSNEIATIYLLYTHNCLESSSVKSSLETVASSAKLLVQNQSVAVVAKELGLGEIQHLYSSLTKTIVVEDEIHFAVGAFFWEKAEDWSAVSTTISGLELHQLWAKYKTDLFSANIRGFLGMSSRKTNINRGILETIQQEPARFWVYNNGITILTKKIKAEGERLSVQGVSIINGAQTTGVLGNAPPDSAKLVRVPCRFVECNVPEIVESIIEKNNTQNEIKSFDLRSNDPTQRRLGEEFQRKHNIKYVHRREGANRLPTGAIQAEVLAPYLASFHGQFQAATRQRRSIFEDRSVYGSVFQVGITPEHIYLVQTLADAVSEYKLELKKKERELDANKPEQSIHEMLEYSTAKFFVTAVVSELGAMVLGKPLPSKASWVVRAQYVKPDRSPLVARWKVVVEALAPLIASNVGNGIAGYETVRTGSRLKEIADKVGLIIQAIKRQLEPSFSPIRDVSELKS